MKKILFVIFFSLFIVSCEKDEILIDDTSQTNEIVSSVVSFYPKIDAKKRLVFNNMTHFANFMEALDKLSLEEIQRINENHKFTSSYAKRIQREQKLGYKITSNIIEDKKFASILNENNEIFFEKESMIYQANHDYCFYVHMNDYDLINEFRNDNNVKSYKFSENKEYIEYKSILKVAKTIQESSEMKILAKGERSDMFSVDPKRKLIGQTGRRNYLVYQTVFGETRCERRDGPWYNRWKKRKIDYMSLYLAGGLKSGPASLPFSYSLLDIPNVDELYINLFRAYGIGVKISSSVIPQANILTGFPSLTADSEAYHSGWYRGEKVELTTNW